MKTWNWKNLEAYLKLLCCLCVPHLLQEQKHNEYIYVKISSKKLRFPTHLFQKTKLGNTISSTISSSLHLRNIFSLILTARLNGHNSDPLNFLWNF
jgi:hypothetical protein